MAGIADIYNGLVAAIGPNVPILLGKRELARNVDFPQFWIVPVREDYGGTQGPGASGNPRVLNQRRLAFDVYTWGSDFGPTEDLHEAMITAIRGVLGGANYQLLGADWDEPTDMERGIAIILHVAVNLNVTQKTLPIPAPDSAPDAKLQTIQLPPVNFDTAGTVPGDGKLDAGEG